MVRCPGQDPRRLTVSYRPCPHCGYAVEFFSDELVRTCPRCKAEVSQEQMPNCIQWCQAARQCLGPQRYDAIMNQMHRHKEISMPSQTAPGHDWTTAALTDLADHIVATHHAFLRTQLPRLQALLRRCRGLGPCGEIQSVFESLKAEIELHLMKEEQILFPYIRQIEAFARGHGPRPVAHCGSVQNPIGQMRYEHDLATEALERMRRLSDDYALAPPVAESLRELYEGLQALEADLKAHIRLENDVLFPRAIELESSTGAVQTESR